jgi:bacteriocin biosynthesis cyclodehydratase domain-containing protein
VVGTIQATEAVKVLLGIGEPLVGRLLTYDALGMRFREVKLRRDPHCPLCGTSPSIKDLTLHRPGRDGACGAGADSDDEAAAVGAPAARRGG